ncbi:hypothetical protein HPB51_001306 [Rhipicephalus microplus]|uniref:Uncharacterized protein n=1 Tax=Rhipicephalus microplus TaxID=6941 RepID=A0A9J6D8D7_RHIMP|nr:hypothetical protein HPB51_001306 [Rhipicephalus microplus]
MQLGRLGRLHAILLEEKRDKSSTATDEDDEQRDEYGRKSNISLLDQHTELKKKAEALMGVAELAKGIQYDQPIQTGKILFDVGGSVLVTLELRNLSQTGHILGDYHDQECILEILQAEHITLKYVKTMLHLLSICSKVGKLCHSRK